MSELKRKIQYLISEFPRNFMRVIKSKVNQKLLLEIYDQTSFLHASLKTKLFWILNNITDWKDDKVCCKVCGKPFKNCNVISIAKGYKQTCSKTCERKLAYKHIQETCKQKYACNNAFQIAHVKEKLAKEQIEIQNKRDTTRKLHFKNEKGWNYTKSLETRLRKYGNAWNLDAIKLTKFINHDDPNWNNSEKNIQTKRKNGTFNMSLQEEITYQLLCQKFKSEDIIRQFKSEKYPFLCDFYIKSLDLFIECNYSWTHGGCFFDENNQLCIEKLTKWKEKAKKSKFYQNAIETWTKRDVNKVKIAKKNSLNYLVFWTVPEANIWITNYEEK